MMLKKNILCWLLLSAILVKTGEPFFVDIGRGVLGVVKSSRWVVGGLCPIRVDGVGCLCSVRAIFGRRGPCDARPVGDSVRSRSHRTADFRVVFCLRGLRWGRDSEAIKTRAWNSGELQIFTTERQSSEQ